MNRLTKIGVTALALTVVAVGLTIGGLAAIGRGYNAWEDE